MTAAQDLRYLVDVAYPEIVANLTTMLTNLNVELAAVEAETTTVTDGVLGASTTDHEAKLEAKRAANGWDYVTTWGDYGILNLKDDWAIWNFFGAPITIGLLRLSNNSFRITSLTPPVFPDHMPVLCQGGSIIREVASSVTVPGVSVTVTLKTGTALPLPLISVDRAYGVYAYLGVGWDGDAGIIQAQDAFDLGYSQINDEISLTGTYGLLAQEENITTGIDVQTLNKEKYEQFIIDYEPYAAA